MGTVKDPVVEARQVAVVGSPSSNYALTLNLLASAANEPLVGQMLFAVNPVGGTDELALGTVTEVTTINQWHENPAMQGLIKERGTSAMSGAAGDVRVASVRMQACYRRPSHAPRWAQAGTALSMSPSTGKPVSVATDALLTDLVRTDPLVHYMGRMHGAQDVRLPFNLPDFAGPEGALHMGVFGQSGSGKSAMTSYLLASLMRHSGLGVVMIDPQGQWAGEHGLPFSVQGWAGELGRPVRVRRISEDLRLEKDAPLLAQMCSKNDVWRTSFRVKKGVTDTVDALEAEFVRYLRDHASDWDRTDPAQVFKGFLEHATSASVAGRIYATDSARDKFITAGLDTLNTPADLEEALGLFTPLHNLFAGTNPDGGVRHSLFATMSEAFDPAHKGPRPYVVLDLSTRGEGSGQRWAALDSDAIKALILRKVCQRLKVVAESFFRDGKSLNTLVGYDEAWRYAPNPRLASDPEIASLSVELAGYARDTRKFGIGWLAITQTPRSLNRDIWDQLAIRVFGYGLTGPDLDMVAEVLDDREYLKLYRSFSPPAATNPRVYPWMLTGPVSPLSFSKAPLFMNAYTDFDVFRGDNDSWVRSARLSQGLPVLAGAPRELSNEQTGRKKISGRREPLNRAAVAALLGGATSSSADPSAPGTGAGDSADEQTPTAGTSAASTPPPVPVDAGVGLVTDPDWATSLASLSSDAPEAGTSVWDFLPDDPPF